MRYHHHAAAKKTEGGISVKVETLMEYSETKTGTNVEKVSEIKSKKRHSTKPADEKEVRLLLSRIARGEIEDATCKEKLRALELLGKGCGLFDKAAPDTQGRIVIDLSELSGGDDR